MIKNKRGMEFSFAWIFAIIVGAVILFGAIYATTKLAGTERVVSGTLVSAELNNLLNPIETNLEDSKYVQVEFAEETRVYNDCDVRGTFGKQGISTSAKIGEDKWGEQSAKKSNFNKYLFSDETEDGQKLNVIIKPLEMPYKIGDLIFAYSESYCFVNSPSDIEEEIMDLSADGENDIDIELKENLNECPADSIAVCFNQIGCDINVNLQNDVAVKNGEELYYDGNLIYGAIFADKEIYECQIKRLAKRSSELAYVYAEKSEKLRSEGCSVSLDSDLRSFAGIIVNDSREFAARFVPAAEDIGRKNELISKCKIF